MPNPPEKYKWFFEGYLKDLNQSSKHIWLSEDPMEITDLTSIFPLDFVASPIETSSYLSIRPENQELKEDLSINNQSTQFFTLTKTVIDQKSIEENKKYFTDSLLQLIREEIFEFGMENAADIYVQEHLRDNPFLTKEWLNSIFLEYFADIGVVTSLLRIIAHLDYTDIKPTGPTMALAALTHKNAEVQECGIRAFENWCNINSLNYLKSVKCDEKWLQTYLEKVISDFEEVYAFVR